MQKGWSERTRSLMKERGITQEQLTAVLGVRSKGAVSHYLSGRRSLSVDQAASLAVYLRCSLDWLVLGKPEFISVEQQSIGEPDTDKVDSSAVTVAKLRQLSPAASRAISILVDQLVASTTSR